MRRRMGSRRCAVGPDSGTASVEFIWLTLLLLIPLVYIVLMVFQTQRAAFGVSAASQAAGRAYIRAPDPVTAELRAQRAASVALADHAVKGAHVHIECQPTPADCLRPGSSVRVIVEVLQPLPLAPQVLGDQLGAVRVDSTHTEPYGSYREARQ